MVLSVDGYIQSISGHGVDHDNVNRWIPADWIPVDTASAGQNAKHGWICTENSFLPFFFFIEHPGKLKLNEVWVYLRGIPIKWHAQRQ
jgi:hypothetical protein